MRLPNLKSKRLAVILLLSYITPVGNFVYAQSSETPTKFEYSIKYDIAKQRPILVNHQDIEIRKNGTLKWKAEKKAQVPPGSKVITSYKIKFLVINTN